MSPDTVLQRPSFICFSVSSLSSILYLDETRQDLNVLPLTTAPLKGMLSVCDIVQDSTLRSPVFKELLAHKWGAEVNSLDFFLLKKGFM